MYIYNIIYNKILYYKIYQLIKSINRLNMCNNYFNSMLIYTYPLHLVSYQ